MNNQRNDMHPDGNDPEPSVHHQSLTLETINDDCLREICIYLNILEVEKLARTCTRLQAFAEHCIYPKIESKFKITFVAPNGMREYETRRIDDIFEFHEPFESFGIYVKHMTLIGPIPILLAVNSLRPVEKVLGLCPNLCTLRMQNVHVVTAKDFLLRYIPNSVTRLELEQCHAITNDCFERMKQIRHLSLSRCYKVSGDFFRYGSHLSSLTLDYDSLATDNDVDIMFKHIGQNMVHLKLIGFSKSVNFESIGTLLMADKFPKLQDLAIEDTFGANLTNTLTELPQLRSLRLACRGTNINPLLRQLSDRGIIFDLRIQNCNFDAEAYNTAPLAFDQLQNLHVAQQHSHFEYDALFNALTRAHMPAIVCFSFAIPRTTDVMSRFMEFFESKKTIQAMIVYSVSNVDVNTFVRRIIEILKRNSNRPHLHLEIFRNHVIGMELVSL